MEEFVHSFREDRYGTVYYLNKCGRQMIGSKKIYKRTLQVRHTLMRNDFYLYVGCPTNWKNELKVTDGQTTIVTDAVFMKNKQYHFLEVDNTQAMVENSAKIRKYREMFNRGLFQKEFGYFPTLHIVTVSAGRVRRFKELCEDLPASIYVIDDIR